MAGGAPHTGNGLAHAGNGGWVGTPPRTQGASRISLENGSVPDIGLETTTSLDLDASGSNAGAGVQRVLKFGNSTPHISQATLGAQGALPREDGVLGNGAALDGGDEDSREFEV